MKGPHSKLTQQQQEQAATQSDTQAQPAAREFPTVESVLQFDSSQNPIPPAVVQRLQASVNQEQLRPPRAWWRRLLGM